MSLSKALFTLSNVKNKETGLEGSGVGVNFALSHSSFFPLIFLAAAALLFVTAGASNVSAFGVNLDSPGAGAVVTEGEVKFGFTAGGESPLSCAVFLNGSVAANVTAYKNLPVIARANVSAGYFSWKVNCTDHVGETGESGERILTVTPAAPSVTPSASPSASPSPSPSASPTPFPSASPSASPSPSPSPSIAISIAPLPSPSPVVSPSAVSSAAPSAVSSVVSSVVPSFEPSASPTGAPGAFERGVAGSLSGFVVTRGGERVDGGVLQSWRSSVGRAVEFAALFSNDGANALNVSLKVTITGGNVSNEESAEKVVASLDSGFASVDSGGKRVLGVVWIPQAEGVYTVEARVVSGVDSGVNSSVGSVVGSPGAEGVDGSFGKAFLQLNVVRSANADWLFLLAIACLAIVLVAVFKTRSNAKAIKGGGLN